MHVHLLINAVPTRPHHGGAFVHSGVVLQVQHSHRRRRRRRRRRHHSGRLFGNPARRGYLSGVGVSLRLTTAVRSKPSGPTDCTSSGVSSPPPSVRTAAAAAAAAQGHSLSFVLLTHSTLSPRG